MQRVMPEFGTLLDSKTEVFVKVDNNEENYYYLWSTDKFTNRLYIMRETLNEFFDSGKEPDFSD